MSTLQLTHCKPSGIYCFYLLQVCFRIGAGVRSFGLEKFAVIEEAESSVVMTARGGLNRVENLQSLGQPFMLLDRGLLQ